MPQLLTSQNPYVHGLAGNPNLGIAVLALGEDEARLLFASAGFLRMADCRIEELPEDFLQMLSAEEGGRLMALLGQQADGQSYHCTYRLCGRGGRRVRVSDNGTVFRCGGEARALLLLTAAEERKTRETEAEKRCERLLAGLRAVGMCVFEVDLMRQLYTVFENAEGIFGVSGGQILRDVQQLQWLDSEAYRSAVSRYFAHPDDEDTIAAAFFEVQQGRPASYEARMKAGGTGYVWCRVQATPFLENGVPVRMIGVISNVQKIRQERERLEKEAGQDAFTGLLNKKALLESIECRLAQGGGQCHALAIVDIDKLKDINDSRGHAAGDRAILAVAQALRGTFRQTDLIGRFGGDEFIVFLSNVGDRREVLQKLERLLQMEGPVPFRCSIGVAFFPEHGSRLVQLFANADAALYHSKRERRVCTALCGCKGGFSKGRPGPPPASGGCGGSSAPAERREGERLYG